MKHMNVQRLKRGAVATLAFGASVVSSVASADLVADATTELGALKTGAVSMGTPILGIVGAIALISIIVMLVRRAK